MRGGKTADEWTDEQVVAQFFATVKVIVKFAQEFRRALSKALVQINHHFAQVPVSPHLLRHLHEGGRIAADRQR